MARRPTLDPDALPVVLRQRWLTKLKALCLAVSFGFLAGAVTTTVATERPDDGGAVAAGGLVVAFAAPLFLYWALRLIPVSCRLRVTPSGIEARHCFVTRRRSWHDLTRFYTRTYSGYRIPDWTGVAFSDARQERAGLASFVEQVLRVRGILRTDLLPDTYGVEPNDLAKFLNACRVRWTGEDLGRVPERIRPTRGLAVIAFSIVTLFAGFFLLGALGAAAEGDWGVAVFALVFASPFLFALVSGIRRWRRGRLGLSAEQR
jgi:hypothetical protein